MKPLYASILVIALGAMVIFGLSGVDAVNASHANSVKEVILLGFGMLAAATIAAGALSGLSAPGSRPAPLPPPSVRRAAAGAGIHGPRSPACADALCGTGPSAVATHAARA